jgi:hypothetical protein
MDVEPFRLELLENKNRLTKQIDFINQGMDEQTEKEIITDLLKHHQGQIIANFYNFLDWCYLRLLQEVILDGNRHKIKIQKSSVSLSFTDDHPEDDAETGSSPFFTLSGLLTDMWNAYKFEPINKKFDMLFKSVDFSLPKNLRDLIIKHIEIRNCIQHHNGRLMPDSLKRLGLQSISIRTSNPKKPILINEWQEILLTGVEVEDLCDSLLSLSQDFSKHIETRIPTRVYSKPTKK